MASTRAAGTPQSRGAFWQDNSAEELLSSYRGVNRPGQREGNIGFRCVLAREAADH